MKNKLIQFLKIAVPIALGVYLVFHIYKQLDEDQRTSLFRAMREANYFWVALSFAMGLLSHYIRGYRWSFQLKAMGYEVNPTNNFLAVMIGYIVNMVLPRVGEVSRAAAITKYEHVPFEKSFGSILSERAIDFIILMMISMATIGMQYKLLKPLVDDALSAFSGTFSSFVLWGSLALLVMGGLFVLYLLNKYREKPFINKLWTLKEGLMEGLRSIFKMKDRGKYFIATALIWVLYVGMFWVCFLAIDETANLGMAAVLAGFVMGSFAIVLIPGGIGAFPVGIMQILLLFGIAAETGFALGWIIWISQTSMIVIVGGISMLVMPAFNRKLVSHVKT